MSYPFSYLTGEVGKLGIARIKRRIVVGNNALVYDTFTGTDGTSLPAHTPDIAPAGSTWSTPTITSGPVIIQISLNEARDNTAINALSFGVIQANASNVILSGDFGVLGIDDSVGFVLRYQNTTNFWWLYAHRGAQKLRIIERNAGIFTTRAEVSATVAAALSLSASVSGDNLSITLGAVTATYYSTFLNTQTSLGFYLRSEGNTCDNFMVMPL